MNSTKQTRRGTPGAAPRGRPRGQETTTVSFRVDAAHLRALSRGADAFGMSLHEYGRLLTYQALDREAEVQFAEEVGAARREIAALREDLAASLEVILTNTTKADTRQIRAWVDANLRHRDAE